MADEASDTAGSGTAVSPAGRYSHVAATVENNMGRVEKRYSRSSRWSGKDQTYFHCGDSRLDGTANNACKQASIELCRTLYCMLFSLYIKDLQWSVEHTKGDPPLGMSWCAYTVVGKRIIIYGGYCQLVRRGPTHRVYGWVRRHYTSIIELYTA